MKDHFSGQVLGRFVQTAGQTELVEVSVFLKSRETRSGVQLAELESRLVVIVVAELEPRFIVFGLVEIDDDRLEVFQDRFAGTAPAVFRPQKAAAATAAEEPVRRQSAAVLRLVPERFGPVSPVVVAETAREHRSRPPGRKLGRVPVVAVSEVPAAQHGIRRQSAVEKTIVARVQGRLEAELFEV